METIDIVESRKRGGATRPRWRMPRVPWRLLSGIAFVAVALAAVDHFSGTGPEPEIGPTPELRLAPGLTDEQQTLLLFHEWTEEQEVAACMQGRGLPYEPDPQRDQRRADRVASLLSIPPAPTGADISSVTMRNAHALAMLDPAAQASWGAALASTSTEGGCATPSHLIYIDDDQVVSDALDGARTDVAFQAYIAEVLWLGENPVKAIQSAALVGAAPTEPAVGDQWRSELERVDQALAGAMVWIPHEAVRTATYADAAGLASDGTALLVRVSVAGAEGDVPASASMLTDAIECSGVDLAIAAWPSWAASRGGVDNPVALARGALADEFCAA